MPLLYNLNSNPTKYTSRRPDLDGFERRKEQKKESIRRAALELFKTYGVKKVSINDIASKAAVSPVTIYNHFGSKEELVRDVVKQVILSTQEKYQAIIEGDKPFLEKLEFIIFDKTEIAREYNGEFVQRVISNDPEIQQFINSIWERKVTQLMIDFFEEGKRQGYINPELSQETILLYTDIFRRGIMAHPGLFAAPEHNEKLVRELSHLYLYGVMGRRDKKP